MSEIYIYRDGVRAGLLQNETSSMICFPLDNTSYVAEALGAYTATRTRGVLSAEGNFAVSAGGGLSVKVAKGIAWLRMSDFWGTVVYETSPTTTLEVEAGHTTCAVSCRRWHQENREDRQQVDSPATGDGGYCFGRGVDSGYRDLFRLAKCSFGDVFRHCARCAVRRGQCICEPDCKAGTKLRGEDMGISEYTLTIEYDSGHVLQTHCDSCQIGRVDDNNAIRLNMVRPTELGEHDLVLFFTTGGQETRVDLGSDNAYLLSRALTQGRTLDVMPAFYAGGDFKKSAGTVTLYLGEVLEGSEAPPEPWPDPIQNLMQDSFAGVDTTREGNTVTQHFKNAAGEEKASSAFTVGGGGGDNGATFIPLPEEQSGGILLGWNNDQGLNNPDPVLIRNGKDGLTTGVNGVMQVNGNVSLSATNIPIADAGGYFTAGDVEGALAELANLRCVAGMWNQQTIASGNNRLTINEAETIGDSGMVSYVNGTLVAPSSGLYLLSFSTLRFSASINHMFTAYKNIIDNYARLGSTPQIASQVAPSICVVIPLAAGDEIIPVVYSTGTSDYIYQATAIASRQASAKFTFMRLQDL